MNAKEFFESECQWGNRDSYDYPHFDKNDMIEFAEVYSKYKLATNDGSASVSSSDLSKIDDWIAEENVKASEAIRKRRESLEMASHGAICAYKKVKELLIGC